MKLGVWLDDYDVELELKGDGEPEDSLLFNEFIDCLSDVAMGDKAGQLAAVNEVLARHEVSYRAVDCLEPVDNSSEMWRWVFEEVSGE